ncbi:phenylalanine--tRNA ligase subunit beta [Helicobacter monodelphidis]|uniref:phenylalanine--tRNA ligase subunit beta n=1 Tax=Helicobacter sp. 15-1451 TaxID=2004995 RepID=UPI000DCC4EF6|nr:phenylalanine--tRNA ligase subunit beta [Helicobacter sp. 15-1451]RAX57691.1 phenylalanine--tRNA ligase subunit beta [Helicobacter sp. 15-1451]
MIFTYYLLQTLIPIEGISVEDIYTRLNRIGLEVDRIEKIKVPDGVVVGFVQAVNPHENADKLQVCQVKIGDDRVLQIVCGARNVAAEQFVAVALEGTKISDTLTIKKSKIRNETSEGMICSATELGLPKINDGIMVLDDSIGILECGKALNEYPLFNDTCFEINVTPNRGDCLSLYGVARDIATTFEIPFELENKAHHNKEDNVLGIGRLLQLQYDRDLKSSLVYKMIQCENFHIPLKVSLILAYNNILVQNKPLLSFVQYVSWLTGTVFQIYSSQMCKNADGDKITLSVKTDENGFESVYANDRILSQIGVKQIADDTQEDGVWIIEASYIPPDILAKRVMDNPHIQKDMQLYYRTSRGSNPNLSESIKILCSLLREMDVLIYLGTQEIVQNYIQPTITVDVQQINEIIGVNLNANTIATILKNLGFSIEMVSDEKVLALNIPAFRHDIHNVQDVAEEILRIMGIDSLPSVPLQFSEERHIDAFYMHYKFERELAKRAISVGFHETIHFVFAQKERLVRLGFPSVDESLDIKNPITQELDTLRPSLLISLLQSIATNRRNNRRHIALFEVGSIFNHQREEMRSIAFAMTKVSREAAYPYAKDQEITLFDFAEKISQVIGRFELNTDDVQVNVLYHPMQAAHIMKGGRVIGILAKIHPALHTEFDIDDCFVAEINLVALFSESPIIAKSFSKFQRNQRDLTLLISKDILFRDIKREVESLNIAEVKRIYPLDIYEDSQLQKGQISLTLRFEIQSDTKTLEESEISEIMNQILQQLNRCFGAVLR